MGLSLSELSQNSIRLNRRRNEQLYQSVYQKRACVGNVFGVFTGHVQLAGMSVFVTGETAAIADLLKIVRQFQLQDFVVQALTFSKLDASLIRNVGRDSFYANAKKCACRSGRNMSNSLCFVEYLFDVFGHVCDWWNARAGWIHKFAVCPEVKLSAMRAFGRNVLGIWICLKKIINREFELPISIWVSFNNLIAFVLLDYWNFADLTNHAAMRATK